MDENGNPDPYYIKFIYKAGFDNTINGSKYRKDGRRKKTNVLPTNSNDNTSALYSNSDNDTRRNGL